MELFRNHQWLVTDEGMERGDGESYYFISMDGMPEADALRGRGMLYVRPPHMAEKSWVDIGSFNEAFEHALRFQAARSGKALDEEMLAATFAEARRISAPRVD